MSGVGEVFNFFQCSCYAVHAHRGKEASDMRRTVKSRRRKATLVTDYNEVKKVDIRRGS